MKRSELIFNIVSIPVDIISLLCAGLVSFYFRIRVSPYIPIQYLLDLRQYFHVIIIAIPVLLVIFGLYGMYNLRNTRKFAGEFRRIFSAISLALLLVIVIFFFDQKVFPSRLIVLVSWAYAIVFVVIGRYLLKLVQGFYLGRSMGLHRLVIINGPGAEVSLIDEIHNNKALGYRVVAELQNEPELIQKLQALYSEQHIEEILQANPSLPQDVNAALVEFARNKGLIFNFVPNLYQVQSNVIDTDEIRGIPVISLKNTPLEGWGKVVKRLFDIVVSLICIVLTSPVFLAISIWIKLDSEGKVLYAAPRGGSGKDFTFYKFRTMQSKFSRDLRDGTADGEAEALRNELWKMNARGGEDSPLLKIKEDPRVTKAGKFLRRTKLDEIPQFLNVLKGDMSMVGPRAHVIDEVNRYRDQHRRLFTIKPGIFGLSQIAQMIRTDLPFEEEVRLNLYYIENWSVWLDIKILAQCAYYIFFARKDDY